MKESMDDTLTGAPRRGIDMKSKPSILNSRRIFLAFSYSLQGFRAAWQHEGAFRQEIVLLLLALPSSIYLAQNMTQWLVLLSSILLILCVEMLNSAIEAIVDYASPEKSVLAGRAKDMGSAAVLISISIALLTWCVVIWQNYFI